VGCNKIFISELINIPFGVIGMAKIKITQVKSGIDRPERQKRTLIALGLTKVHATKEVEATPQVLGMVEKVSHLVTVEQLG
jgi:large subunit ribosomal protein L30